MKKQLLNTFILIIFGLTTFAQPGTIDLTFNPSNVAFGGDGANGTVYTTSIQSDGKIIIGGDFTSYNGFARNRIARLNTDGTLDATFNPGTGANSVVYTTSIQSDGKIIIGGEFTTINGTGRRQIARLNTDGSLDTSFNSGIGYNSNDVVRTVSIQSDGKIIIGGFFTSINGVAINNIARLNTNGLIDTSFNPRTVSGANNVVYTTSIQNDGKIIIGGHFTIYNGIAIKSIARLEKDGSLDAAFNIETGANNAVYTTSIQSDGKIIIGGLFTTINGIAINSIARLNTDGTLDTTFNPGTGVNPKQSISSVSIQSDGKIYIGGNNITINDTRRRQIARLNSDGTLDTTFNSGTEQYSNESISSVSIQSDGKIIIGGGFTTYNGIAIKSIARLNADGALDTYFNPGTGANSNVVTTSIQSDGKIIIGGYFTSYNGFARNSIARLNTDGTLDAAFNPGIGASSYVEATSIQSDGKIIIADYFTTNGLTGYGIARLNTNGTLDPTFTPGINGVLATSIQSDGKIIVGGGFTAFANIYSVGKIGISRLNTNGLIDTSFNPGVGTGANSSVNATSLQSDGKIIIGGSFTSYNGIARNRIARLNTDGSLDTSFNPGTGANASIRSTSIQSDGKIIIGGYFASYNGIARNGIARLNTDGTLDTSFSPGTGTNPDEGVFTTSIQSDGKIIIGGNFTSYNIFRKNRITRINGGNPLGTDRFDENILNIYPNPSNGYFTIHLNDLITTKIIEVYTILGQKIYSKPLTENESILNLSAQPKGVYLYKIFGEKGETKSGKLVIE